MRCPVQVSERCIHALIEVAPPSAPTVPGAANTRRPCTALLVPQCWVQQALTLIPYLTPPHTLVCHPPCVTR